MPRLDKATKEHIRKLPAKDLQDIVMHLASKDKFAYDYILVNYLDKELGEEELFEQTRADLEIIFRKSHKGFSDELRIANMLGACIKRINEFTKISKNKNLEAELLLHILEIPFSLGTSMFGTCFTKYDTQVAMIVKRLVNIVNNKLHEDYKIEYEATINEYLKILHRTSRHINTVHQLPESI